MREIKKIIIHCSATRPGMDIGVKDIRRWHVDENNWDDIGYHYVIRRSGEIENGRNLEIVGAHAAGHNHDSVGVCLVGGMGEDGGHDFNFTGAQMEQLEWLVNALITRFNLKEDNVYGHREFSEKKCPSFDVREWVK